MDDQKQKIFSLIAAVAFLANGVWTGILLIQSLQRGRFTVSSVYTLLTLAAIILLVLGLLLNKNGLNIAGAAVFLYAEIFFISMYFSTGYLTNSPFVLFRFFRVFAFILLLMTVIARYASKGLGIAAAVLYIGTSVYSILHHTGPLTARSIIMPILSVIAFLFLGFAVYCKEKEPFPVGKQAENGAASGVQYELLPETIEPDALNERMMGLYAMLQEGIVTQEEYNEKIRQISSQS